MAARSFSGHTHIARFAAHSQSFSAAAYPVGPYPAPFAEIARLPTNPRLGARTRRTEGSRRELIHSGLSTGETFKMARRLGSARARKTVRALAVRHSGREYKQMHPVKCPVCGANAVGSPYPDRDVQFIECPACGAFDVPETTDLLIMRELSSVQRAILSFWLRHEARGKTPLVLTDELTKRVINEKKLPAPDEQEENSSN